MKNLVEIFEKNGIKITKTQEKQFEKYFELLIETNKKFNLTSITEEDEVVLKHFVDSVLPCDLLPQNAKMVDVGSGAGFPAIPLKIMRNDLSVCMVDSLEKRVIFLKETIKQLNLFQCEAVHSRAEDFAKDRRETFDIAVARAVAPLNTLVEYLLPLVKVGGMAVIYKSSKLEEELQNSAKAIKILGGKVEKTENYTLKSLNFDIFDRRILILKKNSASPKKFPRSGNKPKLQPIS